MSVPLKNRVGIQSDLWETEVGNTAIREENTAEKVIAFHQNVLYYCPELTVDDENITIIGTKLCVIAYQT